MCSPQPKRPSAYCDSVLVSTYFQTQCVHLNTQNLSHTSDSHYEHAPAAYVILEMVAPQLDNQFSTHAYSPLKMHPPLFDCCGFSVSRLATFAVHVPDIPEFANVSARLSSDLRCSLCHRQPSTYANQLAGILSNSLADPLPHDICVLSERARALAHSHRAIVARQSAIDTRQSSVTTRQTALTTRQAALASLKDNRFPASSVQSP